MRRHLLQSGKELRPEFGNFVARHNDCIKEACQNLPQFACVT
jgi:hypothetical protein